MLKITPMLELSQEKWAIVDSEDYEALSKYKWHAAKSSAGYTYYVRRQINKENKKYLMPIHRQIMGLVPEDKRQVDHINGNGLDNRKANLRICTLQENNCNKNKYKKGTSIYKGVSWNKSREKWRAIIRREHLGFFKTEHEAAKVYDIKAKELFGEYAKLNFE